MSKHGIIATLCALTILMLGASWVIASEKAKWQDLFDGKSLNGWEQLNGTAKYEVKDGMIVGTAVLGSTNSFLCTKKNYGDFIIELDFKVDEGLNSGIQIRSQSLEEYKDSCVHGYQVEIDPAQKELYSGSPPNLRANGEVVPPDTEPRCWTGGFYDEGGRRGWLNDLTRNEAARKAFKPGEWNHFRVEALGDSIRTRLNGVPAGSIVDSITPNGFIALQVHATEEKKPMQVWWKNIRIQDLGVNEAKPNVGDRYISDWQVGGTGLVAQVFSLGGGKYQANLLRAFDTRDNPVAVLEGMWSGRIMTFSGDGWTGTIERGHFKGHKGNEKFDMRRVTRHSPTLNALPPEEAIVLFDGTNLDEWASQKEKEWLKADGPADDWKTIPGGRLEVIPEAGSIITKKQFSDFNLHLEFRLLGYPTNSGVYLLARYEVNINDSYGLFEGAAQCGALSNMPESVEPRVPMASPPLQWQTYDIDFRAPRFDKSGKKIEKARITVAHNGVTIHDRVELEPPKGAAKRLDEAPTGPIMLQEHGSPLQFRNIWIVDKAK